MRIRVLGGGWYGCSLAAALIRERHNVELHEIADRLFAGASGGNPARLHLGFHYPRSEETRQACLTHQADFMLVYGHLTRGVPVNIYAVAQESSQVDFGTYCRVLKGDVEFIRIAKVEEFGLRNIDGALLTGERHIVIDEARRHFETKLAGRVKLNQTTAGPDDAWDMTIDCTFSAMDADRIDRYEPCVTVLLEGPADRALTVMDGPFPSIYPWDESQNLSSLTSALYTPLSKECRSYAAAKYMLDQQGADEITHRGHLMVRQMAEFWPESLDRYRIAGHRLSIRAMPKSAADTRLCSVTRAGDRTLRVRAGKIDAVFHAERLVLDVLRGARQPMKQAMIA